MSLIRKPAELIGKETIAALVYGQSGMGKTTLACSAPNPVLFDFDNGVGRLADEHQVPTVQIKMWDEAQEALKEVLTSGEYKTIIIDTASKMIDAITLYVCGTAAPQLRQWGQINMLFKAFQASIMASGRNVIYVAQREVEKSGEVVRYEPQFRQSNYKDVICDLDLCGYMEMRAIKGVNTRTITFDPSPRNEGKNTAGFEPCYALPTLREGDKNDFLTKIFNEYVARQRARAAAKKALQEEVAAKLAEISSIMQGCESVEDFNDFVDDVKKVKPVGDLVVKLRAMVVEEASRRGYTFDKKGGKYAL